MSSHFCIILLDAVESFGVCVCVLNGVSRVRFDCALELPIMLKVFVS